MRAATVNLPASLESLVIDERPEPTIEPGKVKVRWHALSLNFHDYAIVGGMLPTADGRIPISDGAGEIVEVGNHSQLIANKNEYYKLYELSSREA